MDPLAAGNEGQISKDRRSALVTFSIPDDETKIDDIVDSSARRHRGGAARKP